MQRAKNTAWRYAVIYFRSHGFIHRGGFARGKVDCLFLQLRRKLTIQERSKTDNAGEPDGVTRIDEESKCYCCPCYGKNQTIE